MKVVYETKSHNFFIITTLQNDHLLLLLQWNTVLNCYSFLPRLPDTLMRLLLISWLEFIPKIMFHLVPNLFDRCVIVCLLLFWITAVHKPSPSLISLIHKRE
uniref:Ovule protein n=1 Tax=Heterorhabditis bacteriophora TaxID=37862 RepID=A0A1I7W9Y6_HETBA